MAACHAVRCHAAQRSAARRNIRDLLDRKAPTWMSSDGFQHRADGAFGIVVVTITDLAPHILDVSAIELGLILEDEVVSRCHGVLL